jgi:hypothetical protein
MNKKIMYALTWCYEGYDDNTPVALTIAVSEDKEKLKEKMKECIDEDTEVDEDNEWNDDRNFKVHRQDSDSALLQHKAITNLWVKYQINHTNFL